MLKMPCVELGPNATQYFSSLTVLMGMQCQHIQGQTGDSNLQTPEKT